MTNFTPYSFDYYLVIRVSNNSLKKFSYKKFFLFLKALRYFPYILSENSLCPHLSKFCFLSCSSGSLCGSLSWVLPIGSRSVKMHSCSTDRVFFQGICLLYHCLFAHNSQWYRFYVKEQHQKVNCLYFKSRQMACSAVPTGIWRSNRIASYLCCSIKKLCSLFKRRNLVQLRRN